MKVGFVTCVELGFACLREIVLLGHELDVVVTLADDRGASKSGRVYLDAFCAEHGVTLIKADNANDAHVVEALRARNLDWLFVVGWSQIVKRPLLGVARHGALGIHPTLLPEGRGRAPIAWAILKGLTRTGVTLFQLDEGVDSGPIVAQHTLPLTASETAGTLYTRVAQSHAALIREVWPQLRAGHVTATPQDHSRASYWPQRKPDDGRILDSMTVAEVERLVRAVTRPYPGAFFDVGTERLRIWAGTAGKDAARTGRLLILADGVYTAIEFEIEAIPAP